jgi:hypothetical protein
MNDFNAQNYFGNQMLDSVDYGNPCAKKVAKKKLTQAQLDRAWARLPLAEYDSPDVYEVCLSPNTGFNRPIRANRDRDMITVLFRLKRCRVGGQTTFAWELDA